MNIFLKPNSTISKDQIAKLLKTNSETLSEFEKAYARSDISGKEQLPDNFYAINAKQMAAYKAGIISLEENVSELVDRIVKELVAQTVVCTYNRGHSHDKLCFIPFVNEQNVKHYIGEPVTKDEILTLPENMRPELSGTLMKRDTPGNASELLLATYAKVMNESNPQKKMQGYHIFRQGLDICDLDGIVYEMLNMNKASMGYWLPKMCRSIENGDFFKIPNTKIIKVPLSLLQLTRLDYFTHTRTTLDIVDQYCKEVFNLDEKCDYFIKTGTYSSKFDLKCSCTWSAGSERAWRVFTFYTRTGFGTCSF